MNHRRPLFRQLATALILTQLIAATVLGFYVWKQVGRIYREQTTRLLEHLTPMVESATRPLLDNRGALQATVAELAAASNVRVTVIAPDGTVMAESDHDPATMDNHRFRIEVDAAFAEREGTTTRFSATLEQELIYHARRLDNDAGEPIAVVRTAVAVDSARASQFEAFRAGAFVAAGLLLATVLVIFQVSRRVGRNVRRLADDAARFACGDLQHRVTETTTLELSILAQALNHMGTQLERQMTQLVEQRSEQQAILRSMSNGVFALDLQQRFLEVNSAAEKLLKLKAEGTRGRLLQECVREPELHAFVAQALEHDGRTKREFALQQHGAITIRAVSEPLVDAAGETTGLLIVINDVTRLRQLESLRSDFAANVSHELRTPITSMKGYLETLLDPGDLDREQARRFLEIVHRNTMRLEAIIEDLLSLARLERPEARADLEMALIDIAPCIDGAIAPFRAKAAAKSIEIVTEEDGVPPVHGSTQLIEQAIGNLISNAVNYSGSGTTILARARVADDGDVVIEVIDEGPGIEPQHLPRLFERFYRADQARSRALGGTGLGLAIVKHIALVHGGRVEVESTPGRGSTFRLVLPVAPAEQA